MTDVHKVMKAYGVLDEKRLVARRSHVIIDKDGAVRYINIRPSNSEKDLLPNASEVLLSEIKKINKGN